jgi:hypothetical protein
MKNILKGGITGRHSWRGHYFGLSIQFHDPETQPPSLLEVVTSKDRKGGWVDRRAGQEAEVLKRTLSLLGIWMEPSNT